jgi:hypothetical protein
VQQRRLWIPELWRTIAVGLPCMPVVAYYYVLLNHAPFWSVVYGEHIVMCSPSPVALILGYGLVFGLALLGVIRWARRREWSETNVLLATWFVGNGLLLYAPLAFQVRLSAGWHAGMCVVAAVGLHEGLLPWVRKQAWFSRWAARSYGAFTTVRNVVLILTVPSTLLVALMGFRVALAEHYYPYFLPANDVRAVHWLAARTGKDDLLLSSYGIGNYWVAHSKGRSFLGHQFAVLEPQLKDREMGRFYSGDASDEELRQLVTAYGITHVFYGTLERDLGDLRPDQIPWLVPVYRDKVVMVYGVQLASP